MKNYYFFLLVAFILGSQSLLGQEKETIYGSVRTDGYQKITKGAFWETRKEAKMIYDGLVPPGCKVYTLSEEYFVRFVDSEHNKNDGNYIIFPEGAKVYTKDGFWYSALCGNRIEYLRPVAQVKIVEREKIIEVEKPLPESKIESKLPVDYGGKKLMAEAAEASKQQAEPDLNLPKTHKKFFKRTGVIIGCFVVGTGGVGGLLYAILHKGATVPPHASMSGGRPFDTTGTTTGTTSTDSGGSTGGRSD